MQLADAVMPATFLSTPSARRATRLRRGHPGHGRISIHALREEGDDEVTVVHPMDSGISIHALREEGDVYDPDGFG